MIRNAVDISHKTFPKREMWAGFMSLAHECLTYFLAHNWYLKNFPEWMNKYKMIIVLATKVDKTLRENQNTEHFSDKWSSIALEANILLLNCQSPVS